MYFYKLNWRKVNMKEKEVVKLKLERKQNECPVVLCKGKLGSDHCIDCVYFDTSKPECSGSRYFKCVKRGSYHRSDECACSSFVRG